LPTGRLARLGYADTLEQSNFTKYNRVYPIIIADKSLANILRPDLGLAGQRAMDWAAFRDFYQPEEINQVRKSRLAAGLRLVYFGFRSKRRPRKPKVIDRHDRGELLAGQFPAQRLAEDVPPAVGLLVNDTVAVEAEGQGLAA
jgi:hypothetical protein